MLTRRLLVLAALIAPTAARAGQPDPLRYLRQRIEREIDARTGKHPYTDAELARTDFSPAIMALERRYAEAPNKVRVMLNPLLGPAGTFGMKPVTVVSARLLSRSGRAASVEVELTIDGTPVTNRYVLIWDGKRWLIDNAFYPETDLVSNWKWMIERSNQ